MRILVADDAPVMRFLVTDLVNEWGHEAISTSDGEQAWEALCESDGPRIAILDSRMPKLDGVELCRRLKSKPGFPFVYVILLTTTTEEDVTVVAMDAGADDLLPKPVQSTELKSRLDVGILTLAYERAQVEKSVRLKKYTVHTDCLPEEPGNAPL